MLSQQAHGLLCDDFAPTLVYKKGKTHLVRMASGGGFIVKFSNRFPIGSERVLKICYNA